VSRDCAILLGAGVSIDAGIPSSFALTRVVYDTLRGNRGSDQATLFGYVLAKLTARRVLAGGSPFDRINIEDAFDALLRLLQRDQDIISEFVYSWDPILDSFKPSFDEAGFARALAESVMDQRSSLQRGIISVNETHLRTAASIISRSIDGSSNMPDASGVAGTYIDILVSILSNPQNDYSYLSDLVKFSHDRCRISASLNYDLLFENSAKSEDIPIDYGLTAWNEKQIVKFGNGGISFLKLHGSINWSGSPEIFSISNDAVKISRFNRSNALMIFGGQSSKLTPQGPFLQLRQAYETGLMRCNRLLIAGYSFGDDHINAMLRRWVSTRSKAKMVILEPSNVDFGLNVFRNSYKFDATEKRKIIDLVHVKKTAREGINQAIRETTARIDTNFDKNRNGALPHILVKRIE
jgi:hypothetical protein